MSIKQKIWSIPLITILVFSAGMAFSYRSASVVYETLQRSGNVSYPFLHHIQALSENLTGIQDSLLDTLDTNHPIGISRARHKAEEFRKTAGALAEISGKTTVSQQILSQFNDYFSAAEEAALIIIGAKKGEVVPNIELMVIALNKLNFTLQHESITARQTFEDSLKQSRENVKQMLLVSLLSVIAVIAVLAFSSYRLITGVLQHLDSLRAGARKISQGDYSVRIPEQGNDELTMLVQSFNSMGEELKSAAEKRIQDKNQLEALNVELEERVNARTSELAKALQEANKANAAVAFMADHDALTGLLTRRRFQEELDRWSKYALRHNHPMALLFMDMDKFKDINDSYGHPGGDEYLRAVGALLKETLRSTDYIGRWGGDEFAALLPETNSAAACEVANKLNKAFATTPVRISGDSVFASASMGIAVLPEHTSDNSELIAFADAAMYSAKKIGRGCFTLYSASDQEAEHLGEHAHWAGRIRRALETDQFILFFQPVIDLKTLEITEYEALLRMEDQNGELYHPGQFLSAAERFDLSISIDRMVLRKVAYKLAQLGTSQSTLRLSINLTAQFMNDSGIIEYLKEIIREFNIDASKLSIEISEPAILQNMARVCKLSEEIAKLGSQLILDEIGVGFSDFHFLAPLSIRSIKVCGDLIRNINIPSNRDYLVSLCKTCHTQGIIVTAKFVEDWQLLSTLQDIGLDCAQGFAVGRPLESLDKSISGG